MGEIITISGYKKERKKNRTLEERYEAAQIAYKKTEESNRKDHSPETAYAFVVAGCNLLSSFFDTKQGQKINRELEEEMEEGEKAFHTKYHELLKSAPDIPIPRIKYFCSIMAGLVHTIEQYDKNWELGVQAFNEFSDLYTEGVDLSIGRLLDADSEFEATMDCAYETCPPGTIQISKENLYHVLMPVLNGIITYDMDNNSNKLYFACCLAKLFDIYRSLTFLFSEESIQRNIENCM